MNTVLMEEQVPTPACIFYSLGIAAAIPACRLGNALIHLIPSLVSSFLGFCIERDVNNHYNYKQPYYLSFPG